MPNIYNFKQIQIVPDAKGFIDIILSKTNRKTPTIIHKGYAIARIRQFYMRKVKFTQQNFVEKLSQILSDFPLLDEIHPFYGDLINVLYDKDHYKLALGQLNTCRNLIENLSKDYVRLLKYGDSLYRCKQLKKAALGRMCTLMKRQDSTLKYLEQVRQHLSRLPSIDPNTRTLLLCGYPNVGKSSFMNKLTRADVEVQPYAFTTKSLFVGHTDYQYSRWQVIDTPGILDHPLEDRNTIEMQSITALAHIRAAIIYFFDVSETCGYSLKEQATLFENIKPLFANKPLILVANKIDVIKLEQLSEENRNLLQRLEKENSLKIIPMSTLTDDGVMAVKTSACEQLLEYRVQIKLKSKDIKNIMNRIYVAKPRRRDNKRRPAAIIPDEMLEQRERIHREEEEQKERELNPDLLVRYVPREELDELDLGEDHDFRATRGRDYRENYLLKNEDWRFDPIPEFIDGKNIADFLDPDIEEMLDLLEREEDDELKSLELTMSDEEGDRELSESESALYQLMRSERDRALSEHNMKQGRIPFPRTKQRREVSALEKHLEDIGIDSTKAVERVRGESRARSKSKERSTSRSGSRGRSLSAKTAMTGGKRSRSQFEELSANRDSVIPDPKKRKVVRRLERDAAKKRNREGRAGEGDRLQTASMPKHLFSGKRGVGKTQRR
mmetsp:Transcript_9277/g.15252  ORF Transcript_9277/g.15252 Transcript_9277/m.15252 type:complete len:668 (-) Transcript_9277:14-2017(-)